ncbi:MAG: hypothetical protein QOI23_2690, partial [Chloroflexota bacterium]|nr:hypothetical protein [Chloroflexota bacterium]
AALNAYPTSSVTADTYLDAAAEVSDPSVRAGSYVTHRDVRDPAGQERWSTWFNTSLNCTRELYIDDATSLGKKYDLVNSRGLRGVGIWALNYGGGAPELWAALSSHFATCTSLNAGPTVTSPQPIGTLIVVTAAASGCAHALYEFWVKSPAGSWTLAQRYSSSPNFRFNSTARPAGTYLISAWARSAGGPGVFGTTPNRYDAFSAFQFKLTPICSAVSVSTAPSLSAMVGSAVTINSSASGCPNPRYEFWILPPAGTWTLSQTYSAIPTMRWTSAGKAAGSYRFSVWARDLSSPNAYDAFNAFQYTLNPVCSAVSISAAPASTAPVGTPVTITARAAGCPAPLYEVWMLPPGGIWTLVRAYATSPTFKWSSTGKPVGSYRFSVWARNAASPGINGSKPNTFDSYGAFQYTIK